MNKKNPITTLLVIVSVSFIASCTSLKDVEFLNDREYAKLKTEIETNEYQILTEDKIFDDEVQVVAKRVCATVSFPSGSGTICASKAAINRIAKSCKRDNGCTVKRI